jgi:hypothetical protein
MPHFSRKTEGMGQVGGDKHRWEFNAKIDLKEIGERYLMDSTGS